MACTDCKFSKQTELGLRCAKPDNYVCTMIGGYKKEMPTILQQAVSFGKAATVHLMNGMEERTEEEIKKATKICMSCQFVIVDGTMMRCMECGCNLDTKIKWKKTKCNLGYW